MSNVIASAILVSILLLLQGCFSEPNPEASATDLIGSNTGVVDSIEHQISPAGSTKAALVITNPYRTIKRIFDQYNEFQESTGSPKNLDSLRQAFSIIKVEDNLNQDNRLTILLLDVWMYYTVTDFDTRGYVEDVLKGFPELTKRAIDQRIEDKYDWETTDEAPFSELIYLKEKIGQLKEE